MIPASELPIQTVREGVDATDMANAIFGDGVFVVSASYTGDRDSAGIYTSGDSVSPGVTPSDTGVILSTGEVEDFTNSSGLANQRPNTSTNTSGENNNPQFNAAAGARTFDAAYLDVDFIPNSSVMTMRFVFASEEYPEFASSTYQDFFGVWVNGTQVDIDVGNGETNPGNINDSTNVNLYVDNANSGYNTEMDGFTVTLTMTMAVTPGQVNSIRMAVADVSDNRYDSNLLIAGDSVQTGLVAQSDDVDVFTNGSKSFDVLDNDIAPVGSTLTITEINGQSVSVGSIVNLATGQTVEVGSGGELTVTGDGDEEDFNFTYAVTDGITTDVGFVDASSTPCFVAGTLITTPDGDVPVETLQPGDLVTTQDDGAQPLRWIGTRTVEAEDKFAPILIRAGTFGCQGNIMVSPLHRVLVRDSLTKLLFGEHEVLVAARDLVNGHSVTRKEGGTVTYVHLMFDSHQLVFTDGLASESFLPGPRMPKSIEQEVVTEICSIFPELDPETGTGYGSAVRRTLKNFEATVLREARMAA